MSEEQAATPRRVIDWEAIEREYRAGQLSVNEIAKGAGLTEGAIRKRAKRDGWTRALVERVRKAVREQLARADGTSCDGTRDGTNLQRTRTDAEIVQAASMRGVEVVTSHRSDLRQLTEMKRTIAERLEAHLNGEPVDKAFIGDKESPGDLLEKLSRVTARMIPLERQAYNLDGSSDDSASSTPGAALDAILSRLGALASREAEFAE
jgi:hypothetical protein